MRYAIDLSFLALAALLEAGGDALVRSGVHMGPGLARLVTLAAGGLVLFAYGYIVNAASWDFGRLIGIYVVFFFLLAQAIAWGAFGQPPTRGIWLGGLLIVIGGVIITTLD